MSVPVPFSPALCLLVLTWVGAWLAGKIATQALTRDRGLSAVLPFGLGLCFWLLAVHVASLAAGTLHVGLPVGALFAGALGVALWLADRRQREGRAPDAAEGSAPSRWMVVGMVASLVSIAPATLRFHFHDELFIVGHMSIAAELQNGVYPPLNLSFPDLPLRYHYGFDLLVACLTALFRLSLVRAIDLATLGLWALSWCLLWTLGARLAGHRRAFLTPLLVLFGGGLPLGCEGGGSLVDAWMAQCQRGGLGLMQSITSCFFQHPWSLGIPLATTALLLHDARPAPREAARLAVLAAVLAMLSLGEIVLFAGLCPALVVAEALGDDGLAPRRALRMLGVAAGATLLAWAMGGFFTPSPDTPPLAASLALGPVHNARQLLAWHLGSFGVLLPLGVAGMFVLGRRWAVLVLLAAGGLAVFNLVAYRYSTDMAKFATLAALALAIAGSAAIARILPAAPRDDGGSARRARPARTAAAAVLLAAACAWGAVYAVCLALNLDALPEYFRRAPRARPGRRARRGAPAPPRPARGDGVSERPRDQRLRPVGRPPAALGHLDHPRPRRLARSHRCPRVAPADDPRRPHTLAGTGLPLVRARRGKGGRDPAKARRRLDRPRGRAPRGDVRHPARRRAAPRGSGRARSIRIADGAPASRRRTAGVPPAGSDATTRHRQGRVSSAWTPARE